MMDTVIFDIDGTLADVAHRRHHVTGGKKQWDAFFDKMVSDPPLADVCMLAELLGSHAKVPSETALFLFSGRPETHRDMTETWLKENVPQYFGKAEALLMRADGDKRPDTEVKREMLRGVQGQGYEVRLVVDDRPSVVEMWKSEGLTVLAHDSGEWDGHAHDWKGGRLDMMVGPSGAGKSRHVSKILAHIGEYPPLVISSDSLRGEITDHFTNQAANDQVFYVMHAMVKARAHGGLATIVDATNLRARDRRALRDCCPADSNIFYHVIDRLLDHKHRDGEWRDDVVIKGVKLIDKHHQSFQSGLKYIMRGDDDPRVTILDHREFESHTP